VSLDAAVPIAKRYGGHDAFAEKREGQKEWCLAHLRRRAEVQGCQVSAWSWSLSSFTQNRLVPDEVKATAAVRAFLSSQRRCRDEACWGDRLVDVVLVLIALRLGNVHATTEGLA